MSSTWVWAKICLIFCRDTVSPEHCCLWNRHRAMVNWQWQGKTEVRRSQGCKWRTPWRSKQTLPRRSLLCKRHTVSQYTRVVLFMPVRKVQHLLRRLNRVHNRSLNFCGHPQYRILSKSDMSLQIGGPNNVSAFSHVTPCSLVFRYQCFTGSWYFSCFTLHSSLSKVHGVTVVTISVIRVHKVPRRLIVLVSLCAVRWIKGVSSPEWDGGQERGRQGFNGETWWKKTTWKTQA